ncbi:MAG: DUF4843 domain-containing protein [Niabella sp.]
MKYISVIIIFLLLFSSCKKDEIKSYDGSEGISFYIGQYDADSLSYSFAFSFTPKTRDTVFIKMRVTGAAKDYDRTISVKAAAGSTAREGVDYILPEVALPADSLTINYPVIVLNSAEMTTQTFRLITEVVPNEDFEQGAIGQEVGLTYNVKNIKLDITNRIVEPSYWSSVASVFGTFSQTKFQFMVEVTGLTDFSFDAIGIDGYYNLPVKLRNALAAYEAVNGPLIDEFGNRVTF